MTGKIQVIVGGQFGSEGKGHCAAELAAREGEMLAVRTGGPNAGHTVWGVAISERRTGMGYVPDAPQEFKLRQLPVASVVNSRATIALAARSLVQLDLLEHEIKETGVPQVWVDWAATILESAHITVEQSDGALAWGSTQKGIGAARMDRLHRTARTFGQLVEGIGVPPRTTECGVANIARHFLAQDKTVQIEAAQGYGLGLHTEFYPKTTSADCRAIDALADVGLSPWAHPTSKLEVWVVIRPFPIRVAGDSGPLKLETTWKALGLPEERTTVTNKVRRVGAWDPSLVAKAVRANGGGKESGGSVRLWVNMADHVFPFLEGRTGFKGISQKERTQVTIWIHNIEEQTGAPVAALGTGPESAIYLQGY